LIEPHLPNPQTGSPAELQIAADVLRARRLPEDALDFYRAALDRGGSQVVLFNRIGVTELELRRPIAAQAAFKQVLALDARNAESWNNLGAAEYMSGNTKAALADYRKAVKLDRKAAVFHSNLGTALFERQDFEGARVQFATAIKLDPQVFQHSGWAGLQAHVMSSSDRGRFCFEMARLAADNHNDEEVMLWLSRALEAGFDVKGELSDSRELAGYRHDTRLAVLIANSKALRARQLAAAPVPALPGDSPTHN
jgi:tetratricopeptide (TPR) repeat protein